MATKTFVPGTVIDSPWLNDVDAAVYEILGDGTNPAATKAAARTNLGLGTMATQNANAVAITGGTATLTSASVTTLSSSNATITGGTVTGITDLAVADGGTGASTGAAALANLGIGPLGFKAHNNGVAQSLASGVFTQLNFSTETFDLGSTFATNAWTPPAGRLVTMSAAVTVPTAAVTTLIITIYKNGVAFASGNLIVTPAIAVSTTLVASLVDNPNGTDVYTVWAFQNSGGAVNTNGGTVNTYFCGSRL